MFFLCKVGVEKTEGDNGGERTSSPGNPPGKRPEGFSKIKIFTLNLFTRLQGILHASNM